MRRLRSFCCVLIALSLLLALLPVSAVHALETPDFEYELFNSQSKVRIIKYIGPGGDVVIPAEIGGCPVVEIGVSAFEGNAQVTSVTMGDEVQKIEKNAFRECTALQSITLSEKLTFIGRECFYHCAALEALAIPDTVVTVGYSSAAGTFENCTSLKTLVIGGGITIVPPFAFRNCSALEQVEFGENVKQIHAYAFSDCVSLQELKLPDRVAAIEYGAFKNCTSLASIDFGGGLKTLASEAFYHCTSLTSLVLPDSLVSTENTLPLRGVFEACTSLKTVNTGSGLRNIADRMFYDCSALQSITIGESVRSLGDYSFYRCNDLRALRLPDSVEEIGYHAFEECAALERVDFGAGLKVIHGEAFRLCTALRNLNLPDSLQTIEHPEFYRGVFEGCSSLKRIVIGDGIETLTSRLFWGCVSLEEVVIGRNVKTIEDDAFWYCNALQRVYFRGDMPVCDLSANTSLTGNAQWYRFAEAEGFPETTLISQPLCAVTFDCNGGTTTLPDGSVVQEYTKYSQTGWVSEPLIPVREGYTFLGWNKDHVDDGCDYFDYNCCRFEENAVIHAEWRINTYTVLFDPEGGEQAEGSREVVYGSSIGGLPVPMAEDNIFLAWYYTDAAGAQITVTAADIMPAGDLILHALWEKETQLVSVLFDTDGGSAVAPVCTEVGSLIQAPSAPQKEGYTFLGWYEDAGCMLPFDFAEKPIEADTVLYAQWKPEGTRQLPPLHPEELKVTVLSDTAAELHWSAVEGATGYKLYLNDICYAEHTLKQCSYTLTALTPNTEYSVWVTAVNEEGESGPVSLAFRTMKPLYTVTWDVDGVLSTEQYEEGMMPSYKGETAKADDENYSYTFIGWSPDLAPVTCDVTYTAVYEKLPLVCTITWNIDGIITTEEYAQGELPEFKGDTSKADDQLFTYTFAGWSPEIVPAKEDATYTAVYTRAVKTTVPDGRFTDVPENAWYYKEVYAADGLKLMGGISATEFEPLGSMTRAMLVTVLWRMEGSPETTAENPFVDIKEGIWYYKAVIWAAENGIVNGISATEFAPDNAITREQIATILYRYAKGKGYDVSSSAVLEDYPDADLIAGYAKEALSWAVAEKLISGTQENGVTYLDPRGNAIRAQVAAIIVRFVTNIAA